MLPVTPPVTHLRTAEIRENRLIRPHKPRTEFPACITHKTTFLHAFPIDRIMWINLHTTDLHRKYDLPTLVHHEAIPGHVWQGEYANRLPLIRSILSFNAYNEGWALYGEQLGDELGAYDDDPVGRLGYLQSLAFRACRMVVDTGLHARGWSREEGVRFFVEQNGSNAKEVASEVDRYCSWPGQACGYKMGHSEINRQRDRAKAELGDRYDLRDFDQAVVDGGNVPLDVLAQNISGYIASKHG